MKPSLLDICAIILSLTISLTSILLPCASFVRLHKAAVTDHIGWKDGGKAALDASFGHKVHRLRNSRHAKFYWSPMEESTAGD